MIDEDETFRLFGYYSTDLSPKSHKKIVAVCDNPECGGDRIRILQKDCYNALCKSCAMKKRYEDPKERERTRQQQLKRYENSDEHEKSRIAALKLYDDPKEHEKLRIAQKKVYDDPIRREKLRVIRSRSTTKRFEDSKERKRTGDTVKKFYVDNPEARDYQTLMNKEYWDNHPEARDKARDISNTFFDDPLEREKVSKGVLQYISDNPEQAKINSIKAGIASAKAQNGKSSSIELKMRKILTTNGYQFTTNTPLLNLCIPDILFKNEKVIIQCDGDYWHDYPNGVDRDHRQDKILKQNGWQVIRFWEHEINDDIERCLEEFEWETFGRFNR